MRLLRHLIDFHLRGRHRLESIKLLPLGCSLKDAIDLYGQPSASQPSEETPEITNHTFSASPFHSVLAAEWQGAIHSITCWSVKSAPVRDLRYVMDFYRNGSQWHEEEAGYWYRRADGTVRLWCSAVPAIGIAFIDFLAAKAKFKTARDLKEIENLPDFTWAPNNAIFELQRQFIENGNTALFDFANRSEKIAASPDGRHVFIVRQHQAFDGEHGFTELNKPPESEIAPRTQVINCFSWDEDVSSWGKIPLPRDANVDFIGFEGDQCRLQIRHTATGRVLTFQGPPGFIEQLRSIGTIGGPHIDTDLWQNLQNKSEYLRS